jgi:hypothetical protein
MVRLDLHHLVGGQENLRRLGLNGVGLHGVDGDTPHEERIEIVPMEYQPAAAPAANAQSAAGDEHPNGGAGAVAQVLRRLVAGEPGRCDGRMVQRLSGGAARSNPCRPHSVHCAATAPSCPPRPRS